MEAARLAFPGGAARDGRPIQGRARLDSLTKRLALRLRPGEIAVIAHRDLDATTAAGLAEARPAAVVNALCSLSGSVPVEGALVLARAGVPVVDEVGRAIFERVRDGQIVRVDGATIRDRQGRPLGRGIRLSARDIETRLELARRRLAPLASAFVDNTIAYAQKEKALLTEPLELPPLSTPIRGRPAVVVVRGQGYRQDLAMIAPFIRRARPVLIGVDGGADALLSAGWRPDVVVGDMDSVSDRGLLEARELVVHAYPGGPAPGLARVRRLGRFAHVLPAPGTSEDVALLLAHGAGAVMIVAVGTHTGFLDFLEKGRAGMASTVLVRMRVGHLLVDARGLARLYDPGPGWVPYVSLAAAALSSLGAVALASEGLRTLLRLLWLRVRAGMWVGGVG